jgi:hypothetical protein
MGVKCPGRLRGLYFRFQFFYGQNQYGHIHEIGYE